MRIIDLLHRTGGGIESHLRRLAAGDNAAKAWRALKLLELVRQLQSEEDDFEVYGAVWGEESVLRPTNSTDRASVTTVQGTGPFGRL
jgi:hypothetical protein